MKVLILIPVLTLVASRVLLMLFRKIVEEPEVEAFDPPERCRRFFESFASTIADRLSRFLGYNPPDHFEFMDTEVQKTRTKLLLREEVSQMFESYLEL